MWALTGHLASPVVMIFISIYMVSFYRNTIRMTVYHYLEKRFSYPMRAYAAAMFVVGHVLHLSITFYFLAVAFAYYGWEDVSKMAEEIKDPGKALPSILLKGVLAVAVLYLLINLSYLAVLTPSEMAGSELVAQDAITGVFGSAAGTVVVVASLLILISSLNVNFLGLPRVAYGLASHGLAPRAFSKVDDKGTPRNALYFIAVWIGVLAISGSFSQIIGLMMMIAIPVDMMVLLGFFRLRSKRPDLHRPFRVFGYPWIPLITTADIPLAARVVDQEVFVISPRGEEYNKENVGERLSIRNFMHDLRSTGIQTSGPKPYSSRDKKLFAETLDRLLPNALSS